MVNRSESQPKNYYGIMKIAPDASPEAIKRRYRRLARKYHPDVSVSTDAEERFKEITEAYEILKDPEKRAAYDRLCSHWQIGQDFRPSRETCESSDGSYSETVRFGALVDGVFGHSGGLRNPGPGVASPTAADLGREAEHKTSNNSSSALPWLGLLLIIGLLVVVYVYSQ